MISAPPSDEHASGRFVDPAHVLALTEAPELSASEVHLWPFELRADDSLVAACARMLSTAERTRAAHFAFERDRRRYAVAHGVLRRLLSLYSGVSPEAIEFEHGAGGKPSILRPERAEGRSERTGGALSFNLSHSHDRALIGICRSREIGVDLEMAREEINVLSLAESCFFGAEIETIRAAAQDRQRETFFRYWVAKEAVLKGEGIGLGYPLDRFEVTFMRDNEQAGYITSADPARLRGDWTIVVVRLADGWPGAVAARGTGWSVRVCPGREGVCGRG